MAGDRGRIFSSPASVRAVSKPPMIFVVHDGACCACQMATASSVAWSRITVSGEDEVAPSSMAVAPLASIGSMRSDRHASDSVPARRPRLGLTRSLVRMHSNSDSRRSASPARDVSRIGPETDCRTLRNVGLLWGEKPLVNHSLGSIFLVGERAGSNS
jgi:hypothetical protein